MSYGEIFYSEDMFEEVPPNHVSKNYFVPQGVHIMNKNERKTLNKLKRETGLTEDELRKEKKYRKILSEAQKATGEKTDIDRAVMDIVKGITRQLKLPVEHPDVKVEINKILNDQTNYWTKNLNIHPLEANAVIHWYLKLRKEQKKKK